MPRRKESNAGSGDIDQARHLRDTGYAAPSGGVLDEARQAGDAFMQSFLEQLEQEAAAELGMDAAGDGELQSAAGDVPEHMFEDDDYDDDDQELKVADEIRDAGEYDSEKVFNDYEYRSVPAIPEEKRAAEVIGQRTQASSSSVGARIGEIRNKSKYRETWNSMTDVEKYILMLVSEHRHLTAAQLGVLIVQGAVYRQTKGAFNHMKAYFKWVTEERYKEKLDYKSTYKMATMGGLDKKLAQMCAGGLLERINPAYSVREEGAGERFKQAPALFTAHYYLTPLGARVLIVNTAITKATVGFVPTYKSAAIQSILHEAECAEILCSIASCAGYVSNLPEEEGYGMIDVCRFYHEKDVEEKNVVYAGKKIDFKSDGKMVIYSEAAGDFLDFYIEYDSGSSTKDKIRHKTEAFTKYIFWKREQYGERFRKPVLLLVTQKPGDFFPQIANKKTTTYTTGVKRMSHECFPDYLAALNDIAVVLVTDVASIHAHGALGACWHRMDLVTGIPSMKAFDLVTASMLPAAEAALAR